MAITRTHLEELQSDLIKVQARAAQWARVPEGDAPPPGVSAQIRSIVNQDYGREEIRHWRNSFRVELGTLELAVMGARRLSEREMERLLDYGVRIVEALEHRLEVISKKID